jgi:hypothetical protein
LAERVGLLPEEDQRPNQAERVDGVASTCAGLIQAALTIRGSVWNRSSSPPQPLHRFCLDSWVRPSCRLPARAGGMCLHKSGKPLTGLCCLWMLAAHLGVSNSIIARLMANSPSAGDLRLVIMFRFAARLRLRTETP